MRFTTNGKIEIKDVDTTKRRVLSYPSTFGVLDDGGDVVEPGAFSNTIKAWGPNAKNRIKALYQHDPAWLVGKPLSLIEDDRGLLVDTQLSDTPMARDVMTLIMDSVITEQSIGYDTLFSDFDDAGHRHLREVKLYEYSFVTWGMNEFTPIVGVKSMADKRAVMARIDRMEKALKDGRFSSDELPHMMTIAIAQLKESVEATPVGDLVDDGLTPDVLNDPEKLEAWLGDKAKAFDVLRNGFKEGRVLSANNRNLVASAIEALTALLNASESDKTRGNKSGGLTVADELLADIRGATAMVKVKSLADDMREFAASLKSQG